MAGLVNLPDPAFFFMQSMSCLSWYAALQAYAYKMTRSGLNEGLKKTQQANWPALAVESWERGNVSRFINDSYGRTGQVSPS